MWRDAWLPPAPTPCQPRFLGSTFTVTITSLAQMQYLHKLFLKNLQASFFIKETRCSIRWHRYSLQVSRTTICYHGNPRSSYFGERHSHHALADHCLCPCTVLTFSFLNTHNCKNLENILIQLLENFKFLSASRDPVLSLSESLDVYKYSHSCWCCIKWRTSRDFLADQPGYHFYRSCQSAR